MRAETYFTRLEAATQLGIGLRQLHRYQDSGQLAYLRNRSGYIRFTQKQIDDCKARLNTYVPIGMAS